MRRAKGLADIRQIGFRRRDLDRHGQPLQRANHVIENISRIRQCSLSLRATTLFYAPARSAMGCCNSGNTESNTDAPTNLPCDRARRRRRHPHALRHAEGAARHRRTHAARACAQRGDEGRRRRDRRGGRARSRRGGASGARARAQGQDFRAEATARHRACGAGGAQGDRARRRRHIGDVRRHAAGAAANADRIARGAGARRGGGGAGFQAGQSRGLWAAADARRRAAGDPRGARRQRPRNARSRSAMAG